MVGTIPVAAVFTHLLVFNAQSIDPVTSRRGGSRGSSRRGLSEVVVAVLPVLQNARPVQDV